MARVMTRAPTLSLPPEPEPYPNTTPTPSLALPKVWDYGLFAAGGADDMIDACGITPDWMVAGF